MEDSNRISKLIWLVNLLVAGANCIIFFDLLKLHLKAISEDVKV